MLTPALLSDIPRASRVAEIGRSSTVAAAAVPYVSTPLTRGITWSFEPTLGMIPIYGMNGTGSKSHQRTLTNRLRTRWRCLPESIHELEPTHAYFRALCAGTYGALEQTFAEWHVNAVNSI